METANNTYTPQRELLDALNFSNVSEVIDKEPRSFLESVRQINNKALIYPVVVIIISIITLSIVITDKQVKPIKKILLIFIYLFLIFYTIWTHRTW